MVHGLKPEISATILLDLKTLVFLTVIYFSILRLIFLTRIFHEKFNQCWSVRCEKNGQENVGA
jgi:hypothetical protein